jgi:hypothetical protein
MVLTRVSLAAYDFLLFFYMLAGRPGRSWAMAKIAMTGPDACMGLLPQ